MGNRVGERLRPDASKFRTRGLIAQRHENRAGHCTVAQRLRHQRYAHPPGNESDHRKPVPQFMPDVGREARLGTEADDAGVIVRRGFRGEQDEGLGPQCPDHDGSFACQPVACRHTGRQTGHEWLGAERSRTHGTGAWVAMHETHIQFAAGHLIELLARIGLDQRHHRARMATAEFGEPFRQPTERHGTDESDPQPAGGAGGGLVHRTRTGLDCQRIVKHPAYVELEKVAFAEYGLAAMSHRGGVLGWPEPMPAAAKYALTYLLVQAEFGLCCPLSMTDSLTRTLRRYGSDELVSRHLECLVTQDFDALTQGAMFMTEQGAGSDVGATTVRAEPGGDAFRLYGDKWFCSNPDAGLAMVLARISGAPDGLGGVSLFLMPRVLPDGTPNSLHILRLKDKLGTRSMASGEIRLDGARAWLVGETGRGFQQMADMVNNSRLSNGMRAAGLMRRACSEALFIATHRRAFGRRLVDMPLMQRQLLKLLMPAEQARTMMFQTADALRRSDAGEPDAYALVRILTPLIKFRACRDARRVTGDAMEVRGGCGYIEEWSDARLVRDAHLGSIWEGTAVR